jgi:hypothetical protein
MMRPGISAEMLARAGVQHVSAADAAVRCRLAESGLWLPYRTLQGQPLMDEGKPYGRLRLDRPQGGKKYHQAFGTTVHACLPPGLSETAPGGDLYIIEGEFKALSLMEAGFPAVGISGFFGFAGKGGETLVPELADTLERLRPPRLFFCGDSDTALNYQFAVATIRFFELVGPVKMMLPRIPLNGPGKGVDDCREALNGTFEPWWRERLAGAVDVGQFKTAGALAVELVRLEREALAGLNGAARDQAERRLVEMAAALEKEPLPQDKIIGLAVECLGVGRAPFKKAIGAARREMREQAAAAARAETGEPSGAPVDMGLPNGVWPQIVYAAIAAETYFYAQNLCRDCAGQLVSQSAAEICSFVDQPRRVQPYRTNAKGEAFPVKFTEGDGRILLGAWQDALPLLRVVEVKSNVPVLAWDGSSPVLVSGYCPKTRILAGGGKMVLPPPEEAVLRLCDLLRDYDWASPGDLGRAMAFLLTPALVQGGFLGAGRAPLFFVEKNAANAGGSLLIRLLCRIYGLTPHPLTQIDDPKRLAEDVSSRLLAGDGICYVDNARGKGLQKLPWFESLLTEPTFACRIPYKQGLADVSRRVFAISTNGALLSDDLTTRTVKVSINKRPDGYAWHDWPEGGIEEHVTDQRDRYLSAAYALVDEWARAGRPRGRQLTGFRYLQWERACAWLLERHFAGLSLLDAEHKESQKRLADPDHDLLRNLLRVVCEGESRGDLTASSLAEIGASAGLIEGTEEQNKFRIGKALKRRFPTDGEHGFDGGRFQVTRETRESLSGKDVCPPPCPIKPRQSPRLPRARPVPSPRNPRESPRSPFWTLEKKIFFLGTKKGEKKTLLYREKKWGVSGILGDLRGFSRRERGPSRRKPSRANRGSRF